jgi:hypothetical protein
MNEAKNESERKYENWIEWMRFVNEKQDYKWEKVWKLTIEERKEKVMDVDKEKKWKQSEIWKIELIDSCLWKNRILKKWENVWKLLRESNFVKTEKIVSEDKRDNWKLTIENDIYAWTGTLKSERKCESMKMWKGNNRALFVNEQDNWELQNVEQLKRQSYVCEWKKRLTDWKQEKYEERENWRGKVMVWEMRRNDDEANVKSRTRDWDARMKRRM